MIRRIILVLAFGLISGQNVISDSVNSFALKLLASTANEAGDSLNLALSPYTVWTLLSVIAEGANGNTAKQLETVLNLPADKNQVRTEFERASSALLQPAQGVNLDISNAIFTTTDQSLIPSFQQIAEKYYGVTVRPTNFKDTDGASRSINLYIAKATRDRIKNFVTSGDLTDAQIFLTSALYFKGTWNSPFNASATKKASFYDEKGQIKGQVDMMYQSGPFAYTRLDGIDSYALELPYGNGDKMSMIIILPYKMKTLSNVLTTLAKTPFSTVLALLNKAKKEYVDEDVKVFLPKFSISSDLNLNVVLNKMGLLDLFSEEKAELLGIFPHYLFVSRLIQRAEIEVNEEGTVASAASGAAFVNKSPPPQVVADRPFLYFIVDNPTGTVVFAGKISNPNQLRSQ